MAKYRFVIEVETDIPLKFPVEAQVLEAMTVQLESLNDGDIADDIEYKVLDSKVEVLSEEGRGGS